MSAPHYIDKIMDNGNKSLQRQKEAGSGGSILANERVDTHLTNRHNSDIKYVFLKSCQDTTCIYLSVIHDLNITTFYLIKSMTFYVDQVQSSLTSIQKLIGPLHILFSWGQISGRSQSPGVASSSLSPVQNWTTPPSSSSLRTGTN